MANTKKYILALDQGTTSSRALLFDHDGKEVAKTQKEFTKYSLRMAGSNTILWKFGLAKKKL